MGSQFIVRNRRLDPGGGRAKEALRALSDVQVQPVSPPWGGFVPDLSPEFTDMRDGAEVQNFITAQGILGPPDGFFRVNEDSLPLGTDTPPAAGSDIEPVVGLFQVEDSTSATRQYAITADDSLGHLYVSVGGAWVDVPAAGGVTLTGDTTGAGVAQTLADIAYHPPSNKIIIANNFDPVLMHEPGDTDYEEFSPATLNPFLARSVDIVDDRIVFFNTSEGGTRFQNRVRFTTQSATPSLSGLGAGFIDLSQIEGAGLRIRKLGNVIVCYFQRGYAFLRRRTEAASPFTREYKDHKRGLLGTFSSVEVEEGLHFNVMTDGWYLLDETGNLREVGRRQVGNGTYRTAQESFYKRLTTTAQSRVFCEYDQDRKHVYISWPADGNVHPSEVWIYDLSTDTVWPQNYAPTQAPNCFGRFDEGNDSPTWDSIETTWLATAGAWSDLAGASGRLRVSSGTRDGLVFRYSTGIITFDGTLPVYRYRSFPEKLNILSGRKSWERFYVGYQRIDNSGADPTPIGVDLHNQDGVIRSAVINQLLGIAGTRQVEHVSTTKGGTRLAYDISGTHPAKIVDIQAGYLNEGVEEIKRS